MASDLTDYLLEDGICFLRRSLFAPPPPMCAYALFVSTTVLGRVSVPPPSLLVHVICF